MALTPEEQAQYNALAAKAAQVEESAPAEVAGETAAEVGAAVAEAVADVAVAVAHAVAQEVGDAHDESDKVAELAERVDTAELIADTALAVALLDDEPEEAAEVEAAADVIEEAAETVEEAVEQLDEHHDDAGGGDESDDAPQVKAHAWFKPRGKGKQ